MDNYNNNGYYQEKNNTIASSLNGTVIKAYTWMFIGLLVTAFTSLVISNSGPLFEALVLNPVVFIVLIIAEFAFVWYLSSRIMKMSYSSAISSFMVYSILNGITLSVIFMRYTASSISTVFFITSSFFGFMSLYGLVTKSDLTKLGSLLLGGLIALIIASIVNIFLVSNTFSLIISFIGVIIFLGLTAYDTQKIKEMHYQYSDSSKIDNIAIYGALTLYLDFINLFLYILRILGKARD